MNIQIQTERTFCLSRREQPHTCAISAPCLIPLNYFLPLQYNTPKTTCPCSARPTALISGALPLLENQPSLEPIKSIIVTALTFSRRAQSRGDGYSTDFNHLFQQQQQHQLLRCQLSLRSTGEEEHTNTVGLRWEGAHRLAE